MKATIGIYETQAKALAAVQALKSGGYPEKQISVLHRAQHAPHPEEPGEAEQGAGVDSDDVYASRMKVAATGVGIGAIVGPILGALAGVGVLAIPGLGLIVGAGALAGAVAGLDVGLIGGGIISALAIAGMNKHHEEMYREHLEAGRYIVVAHGNEEQIAHARELLEAYGQHLHIESHV
jgi:hypothetical protein